MDQGASASRELMQARASRSCGSATHGFARAWTLAPTLGQIDLLKLDSLTWPTYWNYDRQNHFALPHLAEAGRRRHGGGVRGGGFAPGPARRPEVPARRTGARPAGPRAVPARGAGGLRAQSSQYLHHLRHRRRRGSSVHRDGISRWDDAEVSHRRQAPVGGAVGGLRSRRLPTRWMWRTPPASSIAT